ncbi:hypothetical protein [Mucilaginibacter sp. 22184]|uniref:hypothetical protein n=1 Tax=Mucilaginibacter sp. 22184 TaxID=3453887 RepID=UPI003F849244
MKNLILLLLLNTAFTAKAQTAQQDSAHMALPFCLQGQGLFANHASMAFTVSP